MDVIFIVSLSSALSVVSFDVAKFIVLSCQSIVKPLHIFVV